MGPSDNGARVAIRCNGEPRTVARGSSVADVLAEVLGASPAEGVAVARNSALVTRSEWVRTEVRDGDSIEVVRATQGG